MGEGTGNCRGGGKAREDWWGEEMGREPRKQERVEWLGGGRPLKPRPGPPRGPSSRRLSAALTFRSLAHAHSELAHKVAGGGGASLALPLPAPFLPLLHSSPTLG